MILFSAVAMILFSAVAMILFSAVAVMLLLVLTGTTQNANITVDNCKLFILFVVFMFDTLYTHFCTSMCIGGWLSTTTHSQVIWIKVPER